MAVVHELHCDARTRALCVTKAVVSHVVSDLAFALAFCGARAQGEQRSQGSFGSQVTSCVRDRGDERRTHDAGSNPACLRVHPSPSNSGWCPFRPPHRHRWTDTRSVTASWAGVAPTGAPTSVTTVARLGDGDGSSSRCSNSSSQCSKQPVLSSSIQCSSSSSLCSQLPAGGLPFPIDAPPSAGRCIGSGIGRLSTSERTRPLPRTSGLSAPGGR